MSAGVSPPPCVGETAQVQLDPDFIIRLFSLLLLKRKVFWISKGRTVRCCEKVPSGYFKMCYGSLSKMDSVKKRGGGQSQWRSQRSLSGGMPTVGEAREQKKGGGESFQAVVEELK